MPENLSEISGYSFTETSTSNRDRSANHRKNNKTENFSQNSYVKPIEFQAEIFSFSEPFQEIQNQF